MNNSLTKHVRIHTGAKPYTSVDTVQAVFSYSYKLKTHLVTSHNEGSWLTCYICEKKFSQKYVLRQHLLRHKSMTYICNECPKHFCTLCGLKSHQLVHSGVRSFGCGLCAKQWLKWFCEAGGGGAHLTKPGWSKPHTHSNPTNLALFRHKITLYRFNHGAHRGGG